MSWGSERLNRYADMVDEQLQLIGEDPKREGLEKTPMRVGLAMEELTSGYTMDARELLDGALFEAPGNGPVAIRDIEFYSLCEHHMLPFFGLVHLTYIPEERIVGLSKVARLVDVFARRLQIQERLTQQIGEAFEEIVEPRGVLVTVEAQHFCMMMRGVQKQQTATVTSVGFGELEVVEALARQET